MIYGRTAVRLRPCSGIHRFAFSLKMPESVKSIFIRSKNRVHSSIARSMNFKRCFISIGLMRSCSGMPTVCRGIV